MALKVSRNSRIYSSVAAAGAAPVSAVDSKRASAFLSASRSAVLDEQRECAIWLPRIHQRNRRSQIGPYIVPPMRLDPAADTAATSGFSRSTSPGVPRRRERASEGELEEPSQTKIILVKSGPGPRWKAPTTCAPSR